MYKTKSESLCKLQTLGDYMNAGSSTITSGASVGDVDNMGGSAGVGGVGRHIGISAPSAQFCREPKTTLKK